MAPLQGQSYRALKLEIPLFLLGATAPVVLLALVASEQGGLAAFPAAPLAMLAPAISAMLVQKFVARRPIRGDQGLGLSFGRPLVWAVAMLLFAVLTVGTFAATAAMNPNLIAGSELVRQSVLGLQGVPQMGTAAATAAAALALTVLLAPFLNLPLFLGEEIGWRGFLTPRLTALLGRRGVLATGAIWALWHLPLILLGHNYPQNPAAGLLVWVPLCMAFSVLLTALRNTGRSVIPAALAHGVLNQLAGLLAAVLLVEEGFIDVLHGPAGFASLLIFGPCALVIYFLRPSWLVVSERTDAHDPTTDGAACALAAS